MDCRTFRKRHIAFVDGRTNDATTVEMYNHLERCERCARFNMVVRRGLLVARNLPPIYPSAGFNMRLWARLQTDAAQLSPRHRLRVHEPLALRVARVANGRVEPERVYSPHDEGG